MYYYQPQKNIDLKLWFICTIPTRVTIFHTIQNKILLKHKSNMWLKSTNQISNVLISWYIWSLLIFNSVFILILFFVWFFFMNISYIFWYVFYIQLCLRLIIPFTRVSTSYLVDQRYLYLLTYWSLHSLDLSAVVPYLWYQFIRV